MEALIGTFACFFADQTLGMTAPPKSSSLTIDTETSSRLPPQRHTMGVQKKTRKFAQVKRVIGKKAATCCHDSELTSTGQRDARLYATLHLAAFILQFS